MFLNYYNMIIHIYRDTMIYIIYCTKYIVHTYV